MSKRIREITTIEELKGLPKEKPLVFLKGFAARLEMDAANMGVLDVAMRCIPPDVTGFVWDGDDYSTNSYSSVVLSLMKRYPTKKWIAAKKQSERQQFYESWKGLIPKKVTVHLLLFDDSMWNKEHYFRLGISMYETVLSAGFKKVEIFCLGGGTASMTHEFEGDGKAHKASKRTNHTRWFLFLFTRKSADGTKVESTFSTGKPNSFLAVEDWIRK